MSEERTPEENAASVQLMMLDKEVDRKVGQSIIKLLCPYLHGEGMGKNRIVAILSIYVFWTVFSAIILTPMS